MGILQALANSGVIGLSSAVFVLFGQNIGTCITAVLASIGTSRSAKRATIIHLMFNMIRHGHLYVPLHRVPHCPCDRRSDPCGRSGRDTALHPAGQIAVVHTSFNIVTTLLLLPLGNYLGKGRGAHPARPPRRQGRPDAPGVPHPIQISSKDGGLGVSAIYYVDQMQHELRRMMLMAQGNVEASFRSVLNRDENELAEVEKTEEYIDFLNKEISSMSPASRLRTNGRALPWSAASSLSRAISSESATTRTTWLAIPAF